MARNSSSSKDYEMIKDFHGLGRSASKRGHEESPKSRTPTLIHIPANGSTSAEASSSHSRGRGLRRISSHRTTKLPSHHTHFLDTLDADHLSARPPPTPLGTRRRGRPPASSKTSVRPPAMNADNDVYVDTAPPYSRDKGKARAHDASPRATRSKSLRKASNQEPISVDSDDDDVQEVNRPKPFGFEIQRQVDATSGDSLALQVKERRRREQTTASTSAVSSSTAPDKFYSRPSQVSRQRSNYRRSDGPIQLEEPNDAQKFGPSHVVVVDGSPEADSKTVTSHQPDRNSTGQSRPKLVDRMKSRVTTSNASGVARGISSSVAASKLLPPPVPPPQPGASREPSSKEQQAALSRTVKRMRTEVGPSSPPQKHLLHEPSKFPFEVRLKAIVISDVWRSRDRDHAAIFVQPHALHCGVTVNCCIKIQYSDIREVLANKLDVQDCGILCLTLTPGSESARKLQETFHDFDSRASGDAAQIQLIASDSSTDDLASYARALSWVTKKIHNISSSQVMMRWLPEAGVKSRISLFEGVKQSPWPGATTEPRQQAQTHIRRTLIVPGADRLPNHATQDLVRTSDTYSPPVPKKKTFDLQPPSPATPIILATDIPARGAPASSASPTLLPLSIPTARPAPVREVEIPRPLISDEGGTILHYPYEGKGAMSLRYSDFEKLLDGGLLNDVVIEFGLKFILEEIRARDPALADSIYVFNTFFFPILMSDSVENSYSKLRRWTAKEDLFSKKYIVIPVNENYHWYLALIVNPAFILTEQVKDSTSEQDKDEVAAKLTLPPAIYARQSSALNEASEEECKAAEHMQRHEAQTASSSEPNTPPLPTSQLSSLSAGDDSATLPFPMDLDIEPLAGTPTKPKADPLSLDQAFIITLDSLGQRHVKLGSKLFEYLWREAWDKKKPLASLPSQQSLHGTTKQLKTEEDLKLSPGPNEVTEMNSAESTYEISRVEAKDPFQDSEQPKDAEATDEVGGVRAVPVQDKRRAVAGDSSLDSLEAEAWSKSLPKAVYIHAHVPEQPNFCDCGIYLLHYFDRFFRQPDKLLKIMVDAKSQISDLYKTSPGLRLQVKQEIENRAKAEWQAGEVSSKRAYWRSKIVELSEGWAAHLKAKREAAGESGEAEPSAVNDESVAMTGFSLQERSQSAQQQDVDALILDAGRAENADGKPEAEEDKQGETIRHGLVITDSAQDDIERSVNDYAFGRDLSGKLYVDNVMAQALSRQHGPLTLEHLKELQREDRQEAASQKSAPEWLNKLKDMGAHDLPRSTIGDDVGDVISMDMNAVVPAREHEDSGRSSPTVSVVSTLSHRPEQRHEQEQAEQQQPHASPLTFGATILPATTPSLTERVSTPPSTLFDLNDSPVRSQEVHHSTEVD